MIRPSLAEAKELCQGNTVVPVAMEMFSDVKTSIGILKNIHSRYKKFYILESVENSDSWGRYSFLGYEPSVTVSGSCGLVTVRNGGDPETYPGDPVATLKEMLARYKSPRLDYLPPFTGGFVGYFSYDFIKYTEKSLKLAGKNKEGFDDFQLMLFDKVIAFDHFRQKIYLIANVETEDLENNYIQAVSELKDMEQLILAESPREQEPSRLTTDFEASFTREQFCRIVEKAQHYIREGDIFQVVPSNRLEAGFQGDLLQTYRILRTTNPSPYMFYLNCGDIQVAGASPETLISLKDGVLTTYPLAGTCPRGQDEKEDAKLIGELLENEKELAEHDMLVDLGRNDLGKISEFGSVAVEEYRQVKRFSHVCHIASKVTGKIRPEFDAIDAIAATLPAGTLSGAPKKRACEIIDELEGRKRGVYGGAVGYIDFTGNMDFCIGIRMVVLKNDKVYVQAGAGIVADSVPEKEYEESMNKAGAVISALKRAKEV